MKQPKVGDWVAWKWAGQTIEGQVEAIRTEKTEIVSKGKRIVRNGTLENPAVVINYKNRVPVLKLASELLAVSD